MPIPVTVEVEMKKTNCREVRLAKGTIAVSRNNVRPEVRAILEKRLKAHAPTWKELAKR